MQLDSNALPGTESELLGNINKTDGFIKGSMGVSKAEMQDMLDYATFMLKSALKMVNLVRFIMVRLSLSVVAQFLHGVFSLTNMSRAAVLLSISVLTLLI